MGTKRYIPDDTMVYVCRHPRGELSSESKLNYVETRLDEVDWKTDNTTMAVDVVERWDPDTFSVENHIMLDERGRKFVWEREEWECDDDDDNNQVLPSVTGWAQREE